MIRACCCTKKNRSFFNFKIANESKSYPPPEVLVLVVNNLISIIYFLFVFKGLFLYKI
nr:MAG TPA: hypothetical protein [Caudoviricetes sp.]